MPPKNDKKRQHYVPKCYLRNFTNGDEFIATFFHSKNKFVKEVGLNSVAYEDYFYGKDLIIENKFEKLEGEWDKAFKAINKNEDVTDKDAQKLIYQIMTFIAFQYARTLRVFNMQKIFEDFLTKFTYEHSASEETAQNMLRKYIPKNHNPMEAPFNISLSTVESFKDLDLLFIKNSSELDFVTSDNPVVLYNKFLCNRNYKGNYGLSSVGLCIFVPMSPKLCLCLFDPKIYFSTNNENNCTICKETVHELNKLFCRNAYEYIFFGKKHSEEYAVELNKFFVDKLESKVSLADSNLGPAIHLMSPSILDIYEFPFITQRKNSKRIEVPVLGPAPARYFRKSTF